MASSGGDINLQPLGYIVGNVSTSEFTFVTGPGIAPPRMEYVVVRGVREKIGNETREVDVLAQVMRLQVTNRLLDGSHTFDETERLVHSDYQPAPSITATASVLGYIDREPSGRTQVRLPRCAALPGKPVEAASDDLLREFFSRDVKSGIELGTLINRPGVPVQLDPNGLRRHLAVIAQTGAGKSYLSGLLFENLLQLGATIVIFDPNSDYVRLRVTPERQPTVFAKRVNVYRVPGIDGRRYSDEEIGGSTQYTVQFSRLSADDICNVAGVASNASNIRASVQVACDRLQVRGIDYTPEQVREVLEMMSGEEKGESGVDLMDDSPISPAVYDETDPGDVFHDALEDRAGVDLKKSGGKKPRAVTDDIKAGAGRAVKYLEQIEGWKLWGMTDVPVEDLSQPQTLSVIDLAGMQQAVSLYTVQRTLSDLWARATAGKLSYPVFVVLEEAHNFAPGSKGIGATECAKWVNRIAAEGRKFQVFLVVITQRPGKIDPDTLSQCGSQIVMKLTNPTDQDAVRRAAESLSESLFQDLPGLNVGEAIVLGNLTRAPAMVRVGRRCSAEGGSDIDVVEALERALRTRDTEKLMAASAFSDPQPRTEPREEI